MKRIRKYVRQVEKHLPMSQRIKVGGSIYAKLRDSVKARETELGRLLNDDEIDAITRAHGEPRQVAERLAICEPGEHPLVDRYLAAIGRHLPKDKAGDILAEMREALDSTIEGKQAETGAPLDENAVSAILRDFGPPMVVAMRYAKRDRLIGPDLYPFFWPTVKGVVGALAALAILLATISALSSGEWWRFVPKALNIFLEFLLPGLGVMLLAFILMDRTDSGTKIAARWNPKSLPHDNIRKPKPLFDSVLNLGFDVLFILWWAKAIDISALTAGARSPSVDLHLAEVWAEHYTVILLLACASAAAHAYDIFHPGWSRLRSGVAIAARAVGMFVLVQLTITPALVNAGAGVGEEIEQTERVVSFLNQNLRIGLVIVALFMAISIATEVWRQIRSVATASVHARRLSAQGS